ncbi:MAG: hypothetical protein AB1509_00320 [Chloroflexota bacterium]
MNADTKPRRREVTFLPPLSMTLTFLDDIFRARRKAEEPEDRKKMDEKVIAKLIEKLSEKEE